MIKLKVLFFTIILSGCSVISEDVTEGVNVKPLDFTNDITLTENYWVKTRMINPIYPIKAVKDKISGYVELLFVIDKSGRAKDIKVIKSEPEFIFSRSAIKSLKTARWAPTESNTSLEPVLTTMQLDFTVGKESYKVVRYSTL